MKHAMITRVLVLLLLVLLLSSRVTVNAQTTGDDDDHTTDADGDNEDHEPDFERDEDGTVWIQTQVMTVILNPKLPSYQYWYTPDENGSLARFRVGYLMVIEFEDINGDGVYQINETLQFAPLEAFDWNLITGAVTDSTGRNTEVYASYVKGGLTGEDWDDSWFEDWMPGYMQDDEGSQFALGEGDDDDNSTDDDGGDEYGVLNLERFEGMTMQFYAHIYMNDYNGTVTDDEGIKANYTISGGVELKVDIEIGNFPYVSNTSKVAVLNYLQEDLAQDGDNYMFELDEEDGEHEIDSDDAWEISDDLGERFEDKEGKDVQDLALVDATTNVTRGFYRWVDKAVMTLPNGTSKATDVSASYWADGSALLIFLAYSNFDGGSLLHDPSMKLIETASPIPIDNNNSIPIPTETSAGLIIGLIALVLIGIGIKRR